MNTAAPTIDDSTHLAGVHLAVGAEHGAVLELVPALRQPRPVLVEDFAADTACVRPEALRAERVVSESARHTLHEPVTELPTRVVFLDRVGRALRGAAGKAPRCAVLLIGLDRFKVINETLGHRAGDDLLRAVAGRFRSALRPSDAFAHLNGDLFAVLCARVGGEREALERAEALTATLAAPLWVNETEIFATATTGIAVPADATATAESLLQNAEVALHRGKRRGAGRCEISGDDWRRRLGERMHLESELRRAVEDDQLRLAFQPIVSLADGRIAGVEALVRWHHPERGVVLPAEFIPLAEGTGLIAPIGAWVLRESCRALARWSVRHPGVELPYVAVNISARQLAGDLPGVVGGILARTGIDPRRLVLEITEGAIMERTASPAAVLQELKALGVGIFLDDFGTGYSSLSRLKHVPLDGLKVDRSFVSGLADGAQDLHIVEAVLGIAAALGLDVVAEGVESGEQAERLLDLGCGLAQGFHHARPMSAHAFGEMLTHGMPRATSVAHGDGPVAGAPVSSSRTASGHGRSGAPEGSGDCNGDTVTLGEAAEALGVSGSTLRRWAEHGRILTTRTAGGHRRFAVSEVSRLNAARGAASRGGVRPIPPPAAALGSLAGLLEADGARVAHAATRALYPTAPAGWFAGEAAAGAITRWSRSLASCARCGDYRLSEVATLALSRRAEMAGATLLERHSFVESFGDIVLRALAARDVDRAERDAVRRLFVSLRQALLAARSAGA
jgi:diguanylate cyclase (GGDEF)-like protein/excisionase family DNA binding protein